MDERTLLSRREDGVGDEVSTEIVRRRSRTRHRFVRSPAQGAKQRHRPARSAPPRADADRIPEQQAEVAARDVNEYLRRFGCPRRWTCGIPPVSRMCSSGRLSSSARHRSRRRCGASSAATRARTTRGALLARLDLSRTDCHDGLQEPAETTCVAICRLRGCPGLA